MLLRRLLVKKELTHVKCVLKQMRYSSQLAYERDVTGSNVLRLSPHKPKQPTREPFGKNLFLGKFDVEFLAYPEPQSTDRNREFFDWLEPIKVYVHEKIDAREIDLTSKVKNEILEDLAKLGVFRAAIGEVYGGLELNNTEYAKLVETVSAVPVLGTYLVKQAAIVKVLNQIGTDKQKSELFPKIASGEITLSLCFSEKMTGSTSEPLEASAFISDCKTFYTIEGRKTCVFDATRANYFLVLVKNKSKDPYVKVETLSAFLIPKDTKGLSVEKPYEMLGQKGFDLCTVNFDKVEIPVDTELGANLKEEDIFITVVSEGKHNIGAQTIGMLKHFLNLLTNTLRESDNFNIRRNQEDSTHEIIGNIAATLYGMESMIYFTTGMMDTFEDQDTTIEKSLVHCYCTNACEKAIVDGMEILGTCGYLKDQPFEKLVRDALTLNSADRLSTDSKVFMSLLGLQHAGLKLGTKIKQSRNPFQYPYKTLKTMLSVEFDPKLYLDENLHPSLRVVADYLEKCVNKLRTCVENLFLQYGILVINQRMDLKRLSEILIEIYAMTAVAARASRSYCIGSRNADDEMKVALIFTNRTYERVVALTRDSEEGHSVNGDAFLKEIANKMFGERKYFGTHPLRRNF